MSLVSPLKSSLYAKGSEFYEISDEYDGSVTAFAGDFEYYGYLNGAACWIIQQHQISTGTWRYVQGRTDYTTNWNNKGSLSYGLYSAITMLV